MAFFSGFSGTPKFSVKTSLTFSQVTAAADVGVQTFTVPGLRLGMVPVVSVEGLAAGVFIGQAEISAKDTLKLTVVNLSGSDNTPGAKTVTILGL